MLQLLLCAQLGAFLAAPDRLLISADDAALGRAIVRSANQHVVGSVELLPPGVTAPPRVLRLVVHTDGAERLTLVLSRGAKLSVARVLRIAGSHGFFDRAEVVALVIDDMRAKLNEEIERARALSTTPRSATAAAVVFPRSAVVSPAAAPAAPTAPEADPPAPPTTDSTTDADTQDDQAPMTPDTLSALTPVTTAPRLRAAAASLTLSPLPHDSAAGRRWRLGLGVSLEVLGLAVGGLGVASLVLDGRCVDDMVPCNYRYDGRTAGTIEAVFGSAAILTGIGLLAALGYERRTPRRPTVALSRAMPLAHVEF